MMRYRSAQVTQRDEALLPRLQALKAEPPFWGYRRIWASLRVVEPLSVNKKRLLRLLREHHLRVTRHRRLKAKRTPTGSTPRPTKPNEWWGSAMTKVLGAGFGWSYMVVVRDWSTKKSVGYQAGVRCTAKHWLVALDRAVHQQVPDGTRGQGLALLSDHGCQPTAVACMAACRTLGLPQALTSYNNPQGNADTERCMRTRKEEGRWLQGWTCPVALMTALERWIADDNEHDLHAALGYQPPRPFEQEDHASHNPPFVAA
jgi:putative transposase